MKITNIDVDAALADVRQQLQADTTVAPSMRTAIGLLIVLVQILSGRIREYFEDQVGILPRFNGVLCHDHWKPYYRYSCLHSLRAMRTTCENFSTPGSRINRCGLNGCKLY